MKKHLTILAFVLLTLNGFSQNRSGNEITAEGIAKMKVKPDLASFRISVSKRNLVEKVSIKELNEEIDKLQKLLLRIGFTEKNIKISEYKVSSDENNDNKKEYTSENTLAVEFVLDNKIIEAFYQEIQNENLKDSDIDFETQVSDELEKTVRQNLIKIAIDEAKSNAENIANALDVKLLNVKQVAKFTVRDFESASMLKVAAVKMDKSMPAMASNQKSSFDKFEVEEKELEETITIVYEIIKK
ncbi:SIMPL domain-containing protein [Flavobacterium sp. RSSB_23]|uniref:SIMPL domain-containing protein n=1 Tax=Flavobacterium sp. RSSB_23 TaxID=3447668 RepID=UPI003F31EF17